MLEVQELSKNFRSVGTFWNLQKHGNNLWKPWNASVSLETPEGYLVDILTRGSYARDFLDIDQGFKDKSPVQSTSEGSQRVKGQGKRKRLDWYINIQEYRGDLA